MVKFPFTFLYWYKDIFLGSDIYVRLLWEIDITFEAHASNDLLNQSRKGVQL